ncbi:YceI family protein [Streptomyces sp. DG2A-72]|uniref:YceI family protein n=1 Tax=Streptomyces sp. DG2A-72 TaxID=3051386 RepID=UPI00265B9FCD|nr:YceI family protein [Streptomyces sp. DG2A-72]MDO0930508.1 YceI family protein [Streptomyces sp. DG2A-72]
MLTNRNQSTVPSTDPYEALTGSYTIDPVHSMIGFSVRHAMISNVRGKFDSFEGLLKLDGSQPSRSEAYVSVQTESLDTGIRERDTHLTGPDFFNSSMFPLMTFRSTGIVDAGSDEFRLSGNLKIKDVELPITIDLEFGGASRDAYGHHRVGFEGTATLQRSDWGLTWNTALETGGVLVSDKVKLILDISAVQTDQTATA